MDEKRLKMICAKKFNLLPTQGSKIITVNMKRGLNFSALKQSKTNTLRALTVAILASLGIKYE